MIEFNVEEEKKALMGAQIKVLGIGGGGSNAVQSMMNTDLEGVTLMIANTDAQTLNLSPVDIKIQIGEKITKGLGAGSNPEIGRRAAEEALQTMIDSFTDADILFLTAGMGGGTGTGATPVIARAAREMGILTVAIVTKPFTFEGKKRLKQAEAAIEILKKEVDTLIIIPNQKLLELVDPKISMLEAFSMVNNVLKQAIKGVADIITKPGHINVDFADVRSIMKGMGIALMGTGRARGEERAKQAALEAISSPLLENINIRGAQGVLINITGDSTLGLYEINDAVRVVYDNTGEDANIIFGSVIDAQMGEDVMVTIIASGFDESHGSKQPDILMPREKPAARVQPLSREVSSNSGHLENSDQTQRASNFNSANIDVDLHDLDAPTYLRKKVQQDDSFE